MGCESSKALKPGAKRPAASTLKSPPSVSQESDSFPSPTYSEKEVNLPPICEAIPCQEESNSKNPVFVGKVAAGGMTLTHFPGRKMMEKLKDSGCDVVVTLQKDKEGAQKVKELCQTYRVQWIQIDFWNLYHTKNSAVLHSQVTVMADLIRSGRKVAIHCAAGIHRTGMFGYAVLRELGYTTAAASLSLRSLREVTYLRVGRHRILGMEDLLGDLFPFQFEGGEEHTYLPPSTEPLAASAA
eukprot:TRINITY_DN9236_c0_g1_i1.p1 TRINITY_DN9236_c0_g1~~TRINITY_DN9236_c0_g1_i1.p1  ORF type:complete len:241 (+),score=26.61 TRINITY_DN9236_c0_g1_i1:60-782(+)